MAHLLFRIPSSQTVAEMMGGGEDIMAGIEALATTFIVFGVTEELGGYGFVAVFVAALALRHFEWEHEYYVDLHNFAVLAERLLMATVLLLFGGALAGGLLAPLTWSGGLVGLVVLLVIRPVAGVLSFLGTAASWPERAIIAFFGIRGIGSFYYLSYALTQTPFQEVDLNVAASLLWAIVGFVVLMSIILHGVSSSPVMDALDRWQEQLQEYVESAD